MQKILTTIFLAACPRVVADPASLLVYRGMGSRAPSPTSVG